MTLQMHYQEKFEQGIEQGIELGREQGQREKLCNQIQKKLAKGKNVPQIADELEETEQAIQEIIKRLEQN